MTPIEKKDSEERLIKFRDTIDVRFKRASEAMALKGH